MKFSVITPSFRAGHWLPLCIASVADQNVESEHIVQDACSDDGTDKWLVKDLRVKAYIEKDRGMYDAINRGMRRASGAILAHLNADEQYLPAALSFVGDYFASHPDIDVLFTNAVIVDNTGDYLAHRFISLPTKLHTLVGRGLATLTCGTFFRRTLSDKHSLFFDATFRNVGDAEWIARVIDHGLRMAQANVFTSVYTFTGHNLSLSSEACREGAILASSAPWWARRLRHFFTFQQRLKRFLAGHYRQLAPFSFAIYTHDSPNERVIKRAEAPTFRWPSLG